MIFSVERDRWFYFDGGGVFPTFETTPSVPEHARLAGGMAHLFQ
jgi:hypothetical protein